MRALVAASVVVGSLTLGGAAGAADSVVCQVGGNLHVTPPSALTGTGTVSLGLGGTCVRSSGALSSGSFTINASTDFACAVGTGVGTLSLSYPGGGGSAIAEFTALTQDNDGAIEVDSVVPDSSSRNLRVALVVHAVPPAISLLGGQAQRADACTPYNGAVIGAVTVLPVKAEDTGLVKDCDQLLAHPHPGSIPSGPTSPGGVGPECSTGHAVPALVGQEMNAVSTVVRPVAKAGLQVLLANGGPACSGGHQWIIEEHTPHGGFEGAVVAQGVANNNPVTIGYSHAETGTILASVSATFGLDIEFFLGTAKASYTVGISKSKSETDTSSGSMTVPPHTKGWIEYGFEMFAANGKLYEVEEDCYKHPLGDVKLFAPHDVATYVGHP